MVLYRGFFNEYIVMRTCAGIVHHDLYFPDGCAPSIGVAAQFLDLVERSEGRGGVVL